MGAEKGQTRVQSQGATRWVTVGTSRETAGSLAGPHFQLSGTRWAWHSQLLHETGGLKSARLGQLERSPKVRQSQAQSTFFSVLWALTHAFHPASPGFRIAFARWGSDGISWKVLFLLSSRFQSVARSSLSRQESFRIIPSAPPSCGWSQVHTRRRGSPMAPLRWTGVWRFHWPFRGVQGTRVSAVIAVSSTLDVGEKTRNHGQF